MALLPWDDIKTVFLDMDGTLLDLHYDNFFWLEHLPKRHAELVNGDPDVSRQHIIERTRERHGTLDWYSVDYWSNELNLDVPALKREVDHLIAIRPHVEDFLERLHRSGRRVVLVTNAHRKTLDIKMEITGIDRWFDALLVSHDFGLPKEVPEFWSRLNELESFDPAHTLFIDDNQQVLESAQQYGIRYLLTLLQPDSKQPQRTETAFSAILHFDEIMPELESANA